MRTYIRKAYRPISLPRVRYRPDTPKRPGENTAYRTIFSLYTRSKTVSTANNDLLLSDRRFGGRRDHLLQTTGLQAVSEMGLSLQHHPVLATMPPGLFPLAKFNSGHQRCQILLWACRKITRSNGSDHRGIEDHGRNLDNHHPSISFSLP